MIDMPTAASVRLRAYAPAGGSLGYATGFVVSRGGGDRDDCFLITNRHVVSGRRSEDDRVTSHTGATPSALAVTFHAPGSPKGRRSAFIELGDAACRPVWREHPGYGSKVDIAAIPVSALPGTEGIEALAYRLYQDVARLDMASEMHVVGFPQGFKSEGAEGLQGLWVRGTVAWPPILDWHGLPRMLVDCRARPGHSGSPVIFWSTAGAPFVGARGVTHQERAFALVGVYSGRLDKDSDIGLVWRRAAIEATVKAGRPSDVDVEPMDSAARQTIQESLTNDETRPWVSVAEYGY